MGSIGGGIEIIPPRPFTAEIIKQRQHLKIILARFEDDKKEARKKKIRRTIRLVVVGSIVAAAGWVWHKLSGLW